VGSPGPRPLHSIVVGDGPTIVLLHGFAMQPRIYEPMARLLADRGLCVVIPDIQALPCRWTFEDAVDCLELTLDDLAVARLSLLGHSFGGGLELGLAARSPERVAECIFSDTLGVSSQFSLAREALSHPLGDFRLATRAAVSAFVRSWLAHPVQVASSALWAFSSDREDDIEIVANARVPCHVLWAEKDTILNRRDGMEFARQLNATFTVAERPPGYGPIDHDWMFDDPELFVIHLEKLGLRALSAGTPTT
jgi:pimeloyl-ACP methyl ester carboxylesterase